MTFVCVVYCVWKKVFPLRTKNNHCDVKHQDFCTLLSLFSERDRSVMTSWRHSHLMLAVWRHHQTWSGMSAHKWILQINPFIHNSLSSAGRRTNKSCLVLTLKMHKNVIFLTSRFWIYLSCPLIACTPGLCAMSLCKIWRLMLSLCDLLMFQRTSCAMKVKKLRKGQIKEKKYKWVEWIVHPKMTFMSFQSCKRRYFEEC